jgi:L-ascorbate metabolism protein UlaG (beta-lactamase superfamily)
MVVFVKWLAHASFEIRSNGKVVYIDLEKYSEPTEKADLVLVTHSHTDHCDPEKIKKVRKDDTVIIAPKDCVSKIERKVTTLEAGEEIEVKGIRVKAVNAYNVKRFRSPGKPYHPKGFGVGYLVKAGEKTIYHAGDTDLIPEMREVGHVDVALLPSGDKYTMDNAEAAEAALLIEPARVIPMHRWSTNAKEFKKKVESTSRIQVQLLQEGEEIEVG